MVSLHPTLSLVILRALTISTTTCYLLLALLLFEMSQKKAKTATLTASPPSKKPDEATLEAPLMKPDEATVAFWRLRRGIAQLPLDVKLQIMFWWLLDHLHLFECAADVSVLVFLPFTVFFV